MKRKLLKFIPTIIVPVASIGAVVSCGNSGNHEIPKDQGPDLLDDTKVEIKKVERDPEPATSTTDAAPVKAEKTAEEKILDLIKTQDFKEDGIYMTSLGNYMPFYDDKGNKEMKNDSFVQLQPNGDLNSKKNIVALTPRLFKFYVVFNNDDNDGLSPDKFEEEFHMIDPNYVKGSKVLNDANKDFGNTIAKDGNVYVNFKNGKLNKWTGSLFNGYVISGQEPDWKYYSQSEKPEVVEVMKNYIDGLHQEKNKDREPLFYLDANGKIVLDDQGHMLRNEHPKKLKHHDYFLPVSRKEGLLTYKKITDKVYEVTSDYFGSYESSSDFGRINSLAFALTPTNSDAAKIYSPFIFDEIKTGEFERYTDEDVKDWTYLTKSVTV